MKKFLCEVLRPVPGRKSDQIIIRVPSGLLNPHLHQQRLLCGTGSHRISKIRAGAGHSCFSGEGLKSLWAGPWRNVVVSTMLLSLQALCATVICTRTEPTSALFWSVHGHIFLHDLLIFQPIYLVACLLCWVHWKVMMCLWCSLNPFCDIAKALNEFWTLTLT